MSADTIKETLDFLVEIEKLNDAIEEGILK